MQIVMINDVGCLIEERTYDVETANEAIMEFVVNPDVTFEIGDTIQIRR